jgi:hypothetical protein
MNSGRSITLEQLEQAKPYKPTCHSEDFSTAKLLTDEMLERAGADGITVPELRAKGCGERPPNRICDLRKDGQAIVTRRDANGVTRYIKAKFLPEEKAKAVTWEKLQHAPVQTDNYGKPLETNLPLFDGAARS